MTALPAEIRTIIVSSVCDLFKTNGISRAEEMQGGLGPVEKCDFCAFIGFSGQKMKGSLVLTACGDLLDASHPSKAMGMDVGEDDYADWLGEISNQVVGRLKNALLKFGIDTSLTTPTVIKGQNISRFKLKNDGIKEALYFQLDKFELFLEAHVNLHEAIDFSALEPDKKAEDEGSSLFF